MECTKIWNFYERLTSAFFTNSDRSEDVLIASSPAFPKGIVWVFIHQVKQGRGIANFDFTVELAFKIFSQMSCALDMGVVVIGSLDDVWYRMTRSLH